MSACWHREILSYGWMDWLVIIGFAIFVGLIWLLDAWREWAGYRVEPAPYIGCEEPTTLQQSIGKAAEKQTRQASEPK